MTKGIQVLSSDNAECIATAMAYLQRFYLHQSLFTHDPQHFVYAMLFLSIKVHEIAMPHQQFCQFFEVDHRAINLARIEQILLSGLNYQLQIHTPISGVKSLVYQFEADIKRNYVSLSDAHQLMLKKVKNQALQACFFSYRLRQLVFCESPGLISLVAFDIGLRA